MASPTVPVIALSQTAAVAAPPQPRKKGQLQPHPQGAVKMSASAGAASASGSTPPPSQRIQAKHHRLSAHAKPFPAHQYMPTHNGNGVRLLPQNAQVTDPAGLANFYAATMRAMQLQQQFAQYNAAAAQAMAAANGAAGAQYSQYPMGQMHAQSYRANGSSGTSQAAYSANGVSTAATLQPQVPAAAEQSQVHTEEKSPNKQSAPAANGTHSAPQPQPQAASAATQAAPVPRTVNQVSPSMSPEVQIIVRIDQMLKSEFPGWTPYIEASPNFIRLHIYPPTQAAQAAQAP